MTGSFGSVTAVTEPVAFPASADVSWKVIVLIGAAASEQVGQAVKSGTPTIPWPEASIMRPAVSCRPQVPTKAVNEGVVVVGGAVVVLTPWTFGLPGCNGRTGDFGADDGVVEQPASKQARAKVRPGRIDRAHLSVTNQERTASDRSGAVFWGNRLEGSASNRGAVVIVPPPASASMGRTWPPTTDSAAISIDSHTRRRTYGGRLKRALQR